MWVIMIMHQVIIAKQKLNRYHINYKNGNISFNPDITFRVKMIQNWGIDEYSPQTNKSGPCIGANKICWIFGHYGFHAFITFRPSYTSTNSSPITIHLTIVSLVKTSDDSCGGSWTCLNIKVSIVSILLNPLVNLG